MQCPTCGTNNATRALHCVKCGATLADAEPGFRDDALSATAAAAADVTGAAAGMAGAVGAVGAVGVAGVAGVVDSLSLSPGERDGSDDDGHDGSGTAPAPKRLNRRERRERSGEPGWLTSALVIGTAVFAAIALLGIWWNLRAPYVDPVPKPPGGLAVTPFNAGNSLPATVAPNDPANSATNEASAALARAQALAAVDAAASGAAAEIAATTQPSDPAPLSASAATAALTAAATTLTPSSAASPTPAAKPAQDDMMQLLSRRDTGAANNAATRPTANADLPAHYDGNDIGPLAATDAQQHASAPGAPVASTASAASATSATSATSAAGRIAAALAQCERYRWFELIPKQRCIWAVCNGRWGKDGCPAGTNPGESN